MAVRKPLGFSADRWNRLLPGSYVPFLATINSERRGSRKPHIMLYNLHFSCRAPCWYFNWWVQIRTWLRHVVVTNAKTILPESKYLSEGFTRNQVLFVASIFPPGLEREGNNERKYILPSTHNFWLLCLHSSNPVCINAIFGSETSKYYCVSSSSSRTAGASSVFHQRGDENTWLLCDAFVLHFKSPRFAVDARNYANDSSKMRG